MYIIVSTGVLREQTAWSQISLTKHSRRLQSRGPGTGRDKNEKTPTFVRIKRLSELNALLYIAEDSLFLET